MGRSEKEKRDQGAWYSCLDAELAAARTIARTACHEHTTLSPDARGALAPRLKGLFAHVGQDIFVEAPFHCAYGHFISLGDRVYLNTGCVILDTAPVRIGAGSMLGPAVHIYCADHHHDPQERARGLERALPVTLGRDVWIGGGAIVLPGVTVGDGAIVGAGSVVTRSVAPGQKVAGSPARPI